jgi:hypothetical protein
MRGCVGGCVDTWVRGCRYLLDEMMGITLVPRQWAVGSGQWRDRQGSRAAAAAWVNASTGWAGWAWWTGLEGLGGGLGWGLAALQAGWTERGRA